MQGANEWPPEEQSHNPEGGGTDIEKSISLIRSVGDTHLARAGEDTDPQLKAHFYKHILEKLGRHGYVDEAERLFNEIEGGMNEQDRTVFPYAHALHIHEVRGIDAAYTWLTSINREDLKADVADAEQRTQEFIAERKINKLPTADNVEGLQELARSVEQRIRQNHSIREIINAVILEHANTPEQRARATELIPDVIRTALVFYKKEGLLKQKKSELIQGIGTLFEESARAQIDITAYAQEFLPVVLRKTKGGLDIPKSEEELMHLNRQIQGYTHAFLATDREDLIPKLFEAWKEVDPGILHDTYRVALTLGHIIAVTQGANRAGAVFDSLREHFDPKMMSVAMLYGADQLLRKGRVEEGKRLALQAYQEYALAEGISISEEPSPEALHALGIDNASRLLLFGLTTPAAIAHALAISANGGELNQREWKTSVFDTRTRFVGEILAEHNQQGVFREVLEHLQKLENIAYAQARADAEFDPRDFYFDKPVNHILPFAVPRKLKRMGT